MLKNIKFSVWLFLMLAVILLAGLNPAGALAQCGGSGSGNMHNQHMGSSGQMGSGQMGMYGNQAPVQTDPNAVTPGYVAPAPPTSGYTDPQTTGGSGQMMNQGGMGSGHSGHMGH